jgi:P27 family predicted phage terminase small subunit
MTRKYKQLKDDIINLLQEKGNYEKTDDKLIDELIYNCILSDKAKKEIDKYGLMVNVIRDEKKSPLFQVNQAVGIYHQSLKFITTLFTKLGISPAERKKLRISETKSTDIFDMMDE